MQQRLVQLGLLEQLQLGLRAELLEQQLLELELELVLVQLHEEQ